MHLNKELLSLFAVISAATLANASLQINVYSDFSCQNYLGSYWPGDCDALPEDYGIGSWLIVCKDGNACDGIEFYNSNGGGCAKEHAVTQLSCGCNGDPYSPSQTRECMSTYGLGVHYWGITNVEGGN